MKVLLISLASSITRRNNAEAILKRHEISYDIIDAVDGRLGLDPLLQRYDESGFIRHRGRKALAGELGCYASHILAYVFKCNYSYFVFIYLRWLGLYGSCEKNKGGMALNP